MSCVVCVFGLSPHFNLDIPFPEPFRGHGFYGSHNAGKLVQVYLFVDGNIIIQMSKTVLQCSQVFRKLQKPEYDTTEHWARIMFTR